MCKVSGPLEGCTKVGGEEQNNGPTLWCPFALPSGEAQRCVCHPLSGWSTDYSTVARDKFKRKQTHQTDASVGWKAARDSHKKKITTLHRHAKKDQCTETSVRRSVKKIVIFELYSHTMTINTCSTAPSQTQSSFVLAYCNWTKASVNQIQQCVCLCMFVYVPGELSITP